MPVAARGKAEHPTGQNGWGDDDPPSLLLENMGGGQLWKGTDSSPSNGIKNPAAPLNKSKVSKVADKQSFQ